MIGGVRGAQTQRRLAAALLIVGGLSIFRPLAGLGLGLGLLIALVVLARRRWRRRRPASRSLRFTREGRIVVGLTVGIGVAAINTANNLLYLVLGMLLTMIIVSGVMSEHTLRGLRAERRRPRQVIAGQPFLTGISLINEKRRLPTFAVQVEDLIDVEGLGKKCFFLKVPPQAEQSTSYRTDFSRRGRYVYQGYRLATRFPFGFFIKSRHVPARDEVVVFPRLDVLERLPAPTRAQIGERALARRGAGREFHGLRAYRQGDDARDVHWKRSAREGRLISREFENESSPAATLYLHTRLPAGSDPRAPEAMAAADACADLAASLLFHFVQRGMSVSLLTDHSSHAVSAGGLGLDAALRSLALVEFESLNTPGATSARGTVDASAPLRIPPGCVVITHPGTRAALRAAPDASIIECAV